MSKGYHATTYSYMLTVNGIAQFYWRGGLLSAEGPQWI